MWNITHAYTVPPPKISIHISNESPRMLEIVCSDIFLDNSIKYLVCKSMGARGSLGG
jgi:hypothetical protein